MTRQAAGQWMRKEGAPVIRRGTVTYALWPEFPRWILKQAREHKPAEGERLDRLRADKLEAELSQVRGEVVPAALYEQRLTGFVGGFVAMVSARLGRFVPDVVSALTPATAKRVLNDIKQELLEGGQEYADRIEKKGEAA